MELGYLFGGFHKLGVLLNSWFIRENAIEMDDWGVPLFQETLIYNNVLQPKADPPIILWCLRLGGKNQSDRFWIICLGFKERDSLAVAAITTVTSNILHNLIFCSFGADVTRPRVMNHCVNMQTWRATSWSKQETFVDPDTNDQQCYTASTYQSGGKVELGRLTLPSTIHYPIWLVYTNSGYPLARLCSWLFGMRENCLLAMGVGLDCARCWSDLTTRQARTNSWIVRALYFGPPLLLVRLE